MKPFIGRVGSATDGVIFGVDCLLVFLLNGLWVSGTVGRGWDDMDGAGADVFNGYIYIKLNRNAETMWDISYFIQTIIIFWNNVRHEYYTCCESVGGMYDLDWSALGRGG